MVNVEPNAKEFGLLGTIHSEGINLNSSEKVIIKEQD